MEWFLIGIIVMQALQAIILQHDLYSMNENLKLLIIENRKK